MPLVHFDQSYIAAPQARMRGHVGDALAADPHFAAAAQPLEILPAVLIAIVQPLRV